jgi:hypothetical protein
MTTKPDRFATRTAAHAATSDMARILCSWEPEEHPVGANYGMK